MVDVGTMREHLDMACVSASEWAKNIGALLDEVEELRRENASLSDELACHRTQAERDRKNVMPDDWAKTLGECVDLAGGFRDEPWSLERRLNIVRDALRTRLMPEGMEWPKFDDGEPVRFGDRIRIPFDFEGGIKGIEILADGRYKLRDGMYEDSASITYLKSERVRHPEPPATPSLGCHDTVAPDSWERWRDDAMLVAYDYCDQCGIDYDHDSDAEAKQAEDLERRAKALVGQGKVV